MFTVFSTQFLDFRHWYGRSDKYFQRQWDTDFLIYDGSN